MIVPMCTVGETVEGVETHGLLIDFWLENCTPRRCVNRVDF